MSKQFTMPSKRKTKVAGAFRSRKDGVQPNQVRKIVDKEITRKADKKYKVFVLNNFGFTVTASITPIFQPTQGLTAVTRIADNVSPTSIKFGYEVIAGDSNNLVRIMVFQWYGLVAPSAGDILNVTGSPDFAFTSYHQHTKTSFKVLYDKTHQLFGTDRTRAIVTGKVIPGKKIRKVRFNATDVVGQNMLYIYLQSDSGGVPNPAINWYSNVRYTDN